MNDSKLKLDSAALATALDRYRTPSPRLIALAVEVAYAANHATAGNWMMHPDGVISDFDTPNHPRDLEFYGGSLIGESMLQHDARFIVTVQPQNAKALANYVLQQRRLMQTQHGIAAETFLAVQQLRDAINELLKDKNS